MKELNPWLLSLDFADKPSLKSSYLGSLVSLNQVKISWDLLKAGATFWVQISYPLLCKSRTLPISRGIW